MNRADHRAREGFDLIASTARTILRLAGWRIDGERPTARRYVLVAAPHTSNWDFVWVMLIAAAMGVQLDWLGKRSMFRWPFGWVFKRLGGIPVDRDARTDLVARTAGMFADRDDLILLMSVEGTRSLAPHWKSGFYRIALAANVPVVLGHLNYQTRVGGFGTSLALTGNAGADMDRIRAIYRDAHGKYPGNATPVRLSDELDPAD